MVPCIYYRVHMDPAQKEKDNIKASKDSSREVLLGLFILGDSEVFFLPE